MTELERAIRRVRGKRTEHVVVLDEEGVELWSGRGSRVEVGTPANVGANGTVIHNHPNGTSFSVQDILTALEVGVRTVVVVGSRHAYMLTLPPAPKRACPEVVRNYLDFCRRTGMELGHEDWRQLFEWWPSAHYERLAISERGCTFMAGPDGVQRGI